MTITEQAVNRIAYEMYCNLEWSLKSKLDISIYQDGELIENALRDFTRIIANHYKKHSLNEQTSK